jgi:hypothetical protein
MRPNGVYSASSGSVNVNSGDDALVRVGEALTAWHIEIVRFWVAPIKLHAVQEISISTDAGITGGAITEHEIQGTSDFASGMSAQDRMSGITLGTRLFNDSYGMEHGYLYHPHPDERVRTVSNNPSQHGLLIELRSTAQAPYVASYGVVWLEW